MSTVRIDGNTILLSSANTVALDDCCCCPTPTLVADSIFASRYKCGFGRLDSILAFNPPRQWLTRTWTMQSSFFSYFPDADFTDPQNPTDITRSASAFGVEVARYPRTKCEDGLGPCHACVSSVAVEREGATSLSSTSDMTFCQGELGGGSCFESQNSLWTFSPIPPGYAGGLSGAACFGCLSDVSGQCFFGATGENPITVNEPTHRHFHREQSSTHQDGNQNCSIDYDIVLDDELTDDLLLELTEDLLPNYSGYFGCESNGIFVQPCNNTTPPRPQPCYLPGQSCAQFASYNISPDHTSITISDFRYKYTFESPAPTGAVLYWTEWTFFEDVTRVPTYKLLSETVGGQMETSVYTINHPSENAITRVTKIPKWAT